MKHKKKSIFFSIFLTILIIATIPFTNLMNPEDDTISQPEMSALVSDLGVRVGDLIYYRVFDSDMEMEDDDPLPQGVPMEYKIQSMGGEDIIYDMGKFFLNGSRFWANIDSPENYATFQVFDSNFRFHMFQLTTIADYATANGTTVEDMDQAWRNEINSITEPISTTYDSSSNLDFHILSFGGYDDDNPSYYHELKVWIDKVTGIVTIMNETETGRTQYKELMGYVKGPDSILPDWTYSNPSNFNIGDNLVVASTNIGDNSEDDPSFTQHIIKFMYRNPETMEDVVVVEGGDYKHPEELQYATPEYIYREESRTIENKPSSLFGSWSNYTCSSGFDSFFFDENIIPSTNLSIFGDNIASMMELVPGYSTVQVGNSLKTIGFDMLGRNAEFYIEGLDGYGFPKVQWTKYWNETDTEWNLEMTVDGTGVIESHPDIGLNEGDINEGDYWLLSSKTKFNSHNWFPSSPDEWRNESKSLLRRYRVTHIFALNASVMAVFGRYTADYSQRPNFVAEYNIFQPLLIFDTNNPASFLTHGGFAPGIEGPPVLLPVVSNWSIYSSQIKSQLESDLVYGVSAIRFNSKVI